MDDEEPFDSPRTAPTDEARNPISYPSSPVASDGAEAAPGEGTLDDDRRGTSAPLEIKDQKVQADESDANRIDDVVSAVEAATPPHELDVVLSSRRREPPRKLATSPSDEIDRLLGRDATTTAGEPTCDSDPRKNQNSTPDSFSDEIDRGDDGEDAQQHDAENSAEIDAENSESPTLPWLESIAAAAADGDLHQQNTTSPDPFGDGLGEAPTDEAEFWRQATLQTMKSEDTATGGSPASTAPVPAPVPQAAEEKQRSRVTAFPISSVQQQPIASMFPPVPAPVVGTTTPRIANTSISDAATTSNGPSSAATMGNGPSGSATTSSGPSIAATTSSGPSSAATTNSGPSEVATTNTGPSEVATTNTGPSAATNTGPSEIATTNTGPSEVATTNTGPSEVATTITGPSEVATTNTGPSEVSTTNTGPSQVATTSTRPSQVGTSTGPLKSTVGSTNPLTLPAPATTHISSTLIASPLGHTPALAAPAPSAIIHPGVFVPVGGKQESLPSVAPNVALLDAAKPIPVPMIPPPSTQQSQPSRPSINSNMEHLETIAGPYSTSSAPNALQPSKDGPTQPVGVHNPAPLLSQLNSNNERKETIAGPFSTSVAQGFLQQSNNGTAQTATAQNAPAVAPSAGSGFVWSSPPLPAQQRPEQEGRYSPRQTNSSNSDESSRSAGNTASASSSSTSSSKGSRDGGDSSSKGSTRDGGGYSSKGSTKDGGGYSSKGSRDGGRLWELAAQEARSAGSDPAASSSDDQDSPRKGAGARIAETFLERTRSRADPDALVVSASKGGDASHMVRVDSQDEPFIASTALAHKRVRVMQLLIIGLVGMVLGWLGNFYVGTSCDFASVPIVVGQYEETFMLHFGLWKYSPVDSALNGYSYCYPYGGQVNSSYNPPIYSRVANLLALLFGTYSLVILWWYLIAGRVASSASLWPGAIKTAVLAGILQLSTLVFFVDRMCLNKACAFGSASYVAIGTAVAWIGLGFELHYNRPSREGGDYGCCSRSEQEVTPRSVVENLEMSDLHGASQEFMERFSGSGGGGYHPPEINPPEIA